MNTGDTDFYSYVLYVPLLCARSVLPLAPGGVRPVPLTPYPTRGSCVARPEAVGTIRRPPKPPARGSEAEGPTEAAARGRILDVLATAVTSVLLTSGQPQRYITRGTALYFDERA